ncbi:hypothetical protein C0J52_17463 [Blattella germanica]|nr:hypothetical protein C0J52_17463 [Blattella germanica]
MKHPSRVRSMGKRFLEVSNPPKCIQTADLYNRIVKNILKMLACYWKRSRKYHDIVLEIQIKTIIVKTRQRLYFGQDRKVIAVIILVRCEQRSHSTQHFEISECRCCGRNKGMTLGKEVTSKWLKLFPSMKPFLFFCLENIFCDTNGIPAGYLLVNIKVCCCDVFLSSWVSRDAPIPTELKRNLPNLSAIAFADDVTLISKDTNSTRALIYLAENHLASIGLHDHHQAPLGYITLVPTFPLLKLPTPLVRNKSRLQGGKFQFETRESRLLEGEGCIRQATGDYVRLL